ncbi:MAG: molybdopterin molybdotransferase MoeA [Actinobacteria bacterium]|nr:molybdopterin molybdotransferase MoeA [Actinomycetota bacterium]
MASPIAIDAALREVLARVRPTPAEEVGLDAALGRRLAVDAVADGPFQPFDNSAMDGFAVRAEDVAAAGDGAPVALSVVDESRAGHPAGRTLAAGEAIAISTGAVLPEGADAVVRVEDTERETEASGRAADPLRGRDDEAASGRDRVLVRVGVPAGANVRRAGEDIAAGETVLRAGDELGPAELGALATIGLDPAPVHRRPRVAVVTSGDELRAPGEPLGPGAIRDSNSRTVPGLARLAGAEVVSVDWTPDEPEATRGALGRALEADVAIVCGGVSVGEHDHVKAVLADLGAEEVFWRVALKPGGPTWFGTRGGTLVFGLPGNPVSVMVTFLTFVRPALIAMAGGDPATRRVTARLGAAYEKPTDRAHAVRCRLELGERGWIAWPLPRQGSHVLTSMLAADALALVPAESAGLVAGDPVEVELLDRSTMGR